MNLARVPDFETNLYLDIVLHHSLNRLYIENPKSAALGSHGIPKLAKQKLLSIVKVKTSFDSFVRVEKCLSGVDFSFPRDRRVDTRNDRPRLKDIKSVWLNGKK